MRSWDDLIREPAPAHKVTCPHCVVSMSGNNIRTLKRQLSEHIKDSHD